MKSPLSICLITAVWLLTIPALGARSSENRSSGLYEKGAELSSAGKYDEALPMFIKAVELNPYYCLGHYGLGRVYLQSGETIDLAIVHLRRAVELDRSFARGYFYLGMAYYLKRSYPAALHAFDSAFKNDPTMIESLLNISIIYDILGKSERSFFFHKKYVRYKTADKEFLFR